jgi:hypothetical protein
MQTITTKLADALRALRNHATQSELYNAQRDADEALAEYDAAVTLADCLGDAPCIACDERIAPRDDSEALRVLRQLMNYVGGWDSPASHPCGIAARFLEKIETAQPGRDHSEALPGWIYNARSIESVRITGEDEEGEPFTWVHGEQSPPVRAANRLLRVGRGSRIESSDGRIVADMTHRAVSDGGPLAPPPRPTAEDDARRLVACWNACAGIDTAILETQGAASVRNATPAGEVPGIAGQWLPGTRCASLAPLLHAVLDSDSIGDAVNPQGAALLRGLADDLESGAAGGDA